jgi:CRP-like cAMP-binding protein
VQGDCLAGRFGDLVFLSDAERRALATLEERERTLRRGAALLRENDRSSEMYLLKRGMMMSYLLLDDGSRQILCFHFPGDVIGLTALAYRSSPETIVSLSDCTICPIERTTYAQVVAAHPRLGMLFMAMTQMERIALTDRLAGVGRTSARSRVAALLLVICNRLRLLDKSIGDAFMLGLTQEEIGDATGLTAVHVNRMLRQLEGEGLIARENGRVTLLREAELAATANYVNRYAGLDLGWLPPAR